MCFSVVWQTYLSWLNRAAEEAAEREKVNGFRVEPFKTMESDRDFEKEAERAVKTEVQKIEKAVKAKQ